MAKITAVLLFSLLLLAVSMPLAFLPGSLGRFCVDVGRACFCGFVSVGLAVRLVCPAGLPLNATTDDLDPDLDTGRDPSPASDLAIDLAVDPTPDQDFDKAPDLASDLAIDLTVGPAPDQAPDPAFDSALDHAVDLAVPTTDTASTLDLVGYPALDYAVDMDLDPIVPADDPALAGPSYAWHAYDLPVPSPLTPAAALAPPPPLRGALARPDRRVRPPLLRKRVSFAEGSPLVHTVDKWIQDGDTGYWSNLDRARVDPNDIAAVRAAEAALQDEDWEYCHIVAEWLSEGMSEMVPKL
jgi:hypothetical protein